MPRHEGGGGCKDMKSDEAWMRKDVDTVFIGTRRNGKMCTGHVHSRVCVG